MGIGFLKQKIGMELPLPFYRKLRGVEGQIAEEEQTLLYRYAKKTTTDTSIVEIGSYRGKSTICLGLGSRAGNQNTVYAIDPHELFTGVNGGEFGPKDLAAFYSNIIRFGLGNLIRQISLSSFEVGKIWNEKIGLLWLDGDHSYEGVKRDVDQFAKHVVPGGFILFHDSYLESVQKVINEMIEKKRFLLLEKIVSTTVLKSTV